MQFKHIKLLNPLKVILSTALICANVFGAEEEKDADNLPPAKKLRIENTVNKQITPEEKVSELKFRMFEFEANLRESRKRGATPKELCSMITPVLDVETAEGIFEHLFLEQRDLTAYELAVKQPEYLIFFAEDHLFHYNIKNAIDHADVESFSQLCKNSNNIRPIHPALIQVIFNYEIFEIFKFYISILNKNEINKIIETKYGNLTLLGWSIMSRNSSFAKELLKHPDIDVNKRCLVRSCIFYFIQLIYDDAAYDATGTSYLYPLNMALGVTNTAFLPLLLSHPDTNPNIKLDASLRCFTPLHQAIISENNKMRTELLLNHPKIELDVLTSGFGNPLYTSSAWRMTEITALLLSHADKMNIHQADRDGDTAYTISSDKETMRLLREVEHIYAEDHEMKLAQHFIRLLSTQQIDKANQTLYKKSTTNNFLHQCVTTITTLHGRASLANPFFEIIRHNNCNVLDTVLELHGTTCNPNMCDINTGLTGLMFAAKNGQLEAIQRLLQFGKIKVNLQCVNFGKTALMYAMEYSQINNKYDVMEALLNSGHPIDFSAACNAGVTALILASVKLKDLKATGLLLNHGANPNQNGFFDHECPPLFYIISSNNIPMMKLMIFHSTNPASLQVVDDYLDSNHIESTEVSEVRQMYNSQCNRLTFLSYLTATSNVTTQSSMQTIFNASDLVRFVTEYL